MNTEEFTVRWCPVHKSWHIRNCPDCMVEANEPSIKREGMREMAEWIEKDRTIYGDIRILSRNWRTYLREKGIRQNLEELGESKK